MSFQYYVTDDGGGTNQSANATDSLYVMPVNDSPVITRPDSATTSGPSSPITFSIANGNPISIYDLETDPASGIAAMSLDATHGTLTLHSITGLHFSKGDGTDDTQIYVAGTYNDINNALDGLVFTPTDHQPALGSILIGTRDAQGDGMGGWGRRADNVDIYINSTEAQWDVNQPPVNTVPGAQTASANNPIVFTGPGKMFSVSDAQAGNDAVVSVTLTASGGSLTLSDTKDLRFTEGDGINDGRVGFWATITQTNAGPGWTRVPAVRGLYRPSRHNDEYQRSRPHRDRPCQD